MKICNKCKTEYPDDRAFCTRCGTTLQPKERICPACGKALDKDTLQFCPYCGNELASSDTSKPVINTISKVVTNNNSNGVKKDNKKITVDTNDTPESTSSGFSKGDLIMCASVTVFSTLATQSAFGVARGIVTGLMFVFAKKLLNQKRYAAMVSIIVVALLANIGLKYSLQNNSANINRSVATSSQTKAVITNTNNENKIKKNRIDENEWNKINVIENSKFYKSYPDLRDDMKKSYDLSQNFMRDASKNFFKKEQRILYEDLVYLKNSKDGFGTYWIFYLFPDTITHISSDIVEYWNGFIVFGRHKNESSSSFSPRMMFFKHQANLKTLESRGIEKCHYDYWQKKVIESSKNESEFKKMSDATQLQFKMLLEEK